MNFQSKLIIFLIISGLVLPIFAFAQITSPQITPPQTLEEVKKTGERALETIPKELPGILGRIWKEEVLPIWQAMYDWFMINIWSKIEGWFKRDVEPRVKEEIEKRKSVIEEEFKKEKEKLKEEAPKVGKSLWEKFKELIR